ncbi:MAG: NAD(P)-binding protein [Pyrinomonadaceae bacterium]
MTQQPEHFDAVVVGSGFGGSVMTYRLAEAGFRVCLLEKGKAYPPNSFPRAPYDLARNFWDPSEGLFGMYNVWSFRGSGGIVSAGLGGGSLIYANIMARKDPAWFKFDLADGGYKDWPVTYSQLVPHYERVERMMNAQKYPLSHEPYCHTPKTLAMKEAAANFTKDDPKGRWMPLNLAVSFRRNTVSSPDSDDADNPPLIGANLNEPFRNYHSVVAGREMPRSTCRL